jgi:alpha-N-arabinofuranosidase
MSDSQTLNAQVFIDTNRVISPISPLLFSGFAEHMGRTIYEGIYDPKSPHADDSGIRKDVVAALRELNFRSMRYPGGNFLSGYRWLDGVGPREQRPGGVTWPGSRLRRTSLARMNLLSSASW